MGRWGSGVEGESGEVSEPIGELDEGGRRGLAGWQAGRELILGLKLQGCRRS